jgi:peptidoglycan/xylan/chitin deacetylase (PgdA/CDA1 family)
MAARDRAPAPVKLRALMYHDVVEDEQADVYAIPPQRFREHLDAIGRAPATVDSLASGDWLITFDDGGSSAMVVGEELARRSWRGHFFVSTDAVGRPGFLDWDGVRAVAGMGHVIGSHSCSHPDRMADLSWEQLLHEWTRSAALLAEELGAPVTTASVPGGLYSNSVGRAAAAAGYSSLFTSLPSQTPGSVDGCRLIGRWAIREDTTAAQAAAAAAGRPLPWARQRAAWRLRGLVKAVAGQRYERVRRTLLARRG